MGYEKQTWQTGDVITANKMNHMEDGIAGVGGSVLVVRATNDTDNSQYILDTTWRQIYNAFLSNGCVVLADPVSNGEQYKTIEELFFYPNDSQYTVIFLGDSYTTNSENGYPTYYYGD